MPDNFYVMNLTEWIRQIKPVFVVAPSARNGITLMQRLLNSTRQIVIYGENVDLMDRLPAMVHTAVVTHTQFGEQFEASRRRFFNETTEGWTSNLWPSSEHNMLIMFEAFNKVAAMYQQTTEQNGLSRWGVKNPMTSPHMVMRLRAIIPQARFIFLYRNLYDVLRSARARKFIDSPESRDQYITNWHDNMLAVLDNPMPDTLIMSHEDLVANPQESIAAIEQFAEVQGIDPAVLDQKINTFVGPTEAGLSPTGYIEPEPLTEEDVESAQRIAGSLLERLGYADVAIQ